MEEVRPVGVKMIVVAPGNLKNGNEPIKQIFDNRQVQSALSSFDKSDISHPFLIWPIGSKVAMQMIFEGRQIFTILVITALAPYFFSRPL